jgi:hypothetical protein
MGMQFVRGLQGDDPKDLKLVATAKHYAVHNGPEKDRHNFNAKPSTRDLWETYLPAFHDLVVDAKVYSVMGAYNRVDGESASASQLLLEDILRNQSTLLTWLREAGFTDLRVVDVSATTTAEQRSTDWMAFESLSAALDPADPRKTIEGLPAPTRAVVICHATQATPRRDCT